MPSYLVYTHAIQFLRMSFPIVRPPQTSTLFPYTTLFRSVDVNFRPEVKRVFPVFTVEEPGGGVGRKRPLDAGYGGVKASVDGDEDRKSTRLNSSHVKISYAVFCLKKKRTITCQM